MKVHTSFFSMTWIQPRPTGVARHAQHSSMEKDVFDTWCMLKSDTIVSIDTWGNSMIWTIPLFLNAWYWHIILECWVVEWFDDATACERDAPSMLVGDQCISLQKTNCRRKLVLTCCSGLAWVEISTESNMVRTQWYRFTCGQLQSAYEFKWKLRRHVPQSEWTKLECKHRQQLPLWVCM